MIKVFCDICGAEFKDRDRKTTVFLIDTKRKVGFGLGIMPKRGYNGDICTQCCFASIEDAVMVEEDKFDSARRGWNYPDA